MSAEEFGAFYDTPGWRPTNEQLREERDAQERRRARREESRRRVAGREVTA